MKWYVKSGFFVTKEMQEHGKGVLPVLLFMLSKLGYMVKPVSVSFSRDPTIPAVRIQYTGDDNKLRTLYYIRGDLSDKSSERILNLIKNIPFDGVFIKAASYLLHNKEFKAVRNYVVNNCNYILQDDTGVPYDLLKKQYQIKLHGYYEKPFQKHFKNYLQKDLKKAFAEDKTCVKIEFPLTYGYFSGLQSHLIEASKK